MIKSICEQCGTVFERDRFYHGKRPRFCSDACRGKAITGSNNPSWTGGRCVPKNTSLYIFVSVPNRGQVHEHVLLAEKALGRLLPRKACVHHFDENRQNNTPSNLVICQDAAYHMLLHARKDRLADTGDLQLKRCCDCKQIKSLGMFSKNRGEWDGHSAVCKDCAMDRYHKLKAQRERTHNVSQ